jgi:adenylate cyclase
VSIAGELESEARDLLHRSWNTQERQTVPRTEDVTLKNGAVKLEAAYLYADLADSTNLQRRFKKEFAAKVMRSYLAGACRIIRAEGGSIKSFDGDRVMGIFVGNAKRNDAVLAGLKINWYLNKILQPLVEDRLASTKTTEPLNLAHGVGVDAGEAFLVRAGVRNPAGETAHNDLISIGRVPNIAAKLSGMRDSYGSIIITNEVHSYLTTKQLQSAKGEDLWMGPFRESVGGYNLSLYSSTWMRQP